MRMNYGDYGCLTELSNEDELWGLTLLNNANNNNTDISWSILIGGMNRKKTTDLLHVTNKPKIT